MKQRISIWSVLSLLISLIAFALYAILLDGTNVSFPWMVTSLIAPFFPILSKYLRLRRMQMGKGLEIAALVIGSFDFYFYFFAATKINLFVVFVVIGVICILYAKLFNNVEIKPIAKKQNPQDEFWSLFTEALSEANKNRNEKGPIVFIGQRPNEADYGISPQNPLCSTSLAGTDAYLRRLRTADGKTFTWQRIGDIRSDCNGASDIGMDKYQLYLEGKPYKVLYFVPYVGESTAAPHGMKLHDVAEQDTTTKAEVASSAASVHKQTVKVEVKKHHVTEETAEKGTTVVVSHKVIPPNAKFCSRCGAVIDSTTKKCTSCGKQYFKAKKLMLILVPIVLCAALLGVGSYFVVNKIIPNHKSYQEAEQLYLNEDYRAAALAFKDLGKYKDSADRAQECYDALAIQYIDSAQYQALLRFVRSNGISDAISSYVKKVALEAIDQRDYAVAYGLIPALESIPQSQREIQDALYLAGWAHYAYKQYDTSNEIFASLGEYKDSSQLINYDVLHDDAEEVTIKDLKNNPQKYDGKQIMLHAVVWTIGDFFYVVDKEYYDLYPKAMISPRDFEKTHHIYVIRGYECVESPDALKVGEEVTVVGQFLYEAKGEEYVGVKDGKMVTLTRTENYAELRAKVVYY